MNSLSLFRYIMKSASKVASSQSSPVRPEHVAYAYAKSSGTDNPFNRAVALYGESCGWAAPEQRRWGPRRFWYRPKSVVVPVLRQEIEIAARSGQPCIESVLQSLQRLGELTALEEPFRAQGLDPDEWLSSRDD